MPGKFDSLAGPKRRLHLDANLFDTPSEALGCAMRETLHLDDLVAEMLRDALVALEKTDLKLLSHYTRLREGRPGSLEMSAIHLDVIRDLKRINGYLTSVAYPILEPAGELRDSRLRE